MRSATLIHDGINKWGREISNDIRRRLPFPEMGLLPLPSCVGWTWSRSSVNRVRKGENCKFPVEKTGRHHVIRAIEASVPRDKSRCYHTPRSDAMRPPLWSSVPNQTPGYDEKTPDEPEGKDVLPNVWPGRLKPARPLQTRKDREMLHGPEKTKCDVGFGIKSSNRKRLSVKN